MPAVFPVITIDHEQNAAKDLILYGENGVISKLDAEQLAGDMEKLLRTRKEPAFYMRHAEKYDWQNIIPEISRVYRVQ